MYNIFCINLFKSNSLKLSIAFLQSYLYRKNTRKNIFNKLSFAKPASKQKTHFNFNNPLHFCPKSILFNHNAFPIDALSPPSSRAICNQVDTKTQIQKILPARIGALSLPVAIVSLIMSVDQVFSFLFAFFFGYVCMQTKKHNALRRGNSTI